MKKLVICFMLFLFLLSSGVAVDEDMDNRSNQIEQIDTLMAKTIINAKTGEYHRVTN